MIKCGKKIHSYYIINLINVCKNFTHQKYCLNPKLDYSISKPIGEVYTSVLYKRRKL